VRMSDKWSRLVQLANKPAPAVKDETITDIMTNLAVYSCSAESYGKKLMAEGIQNVILPSPSQKNDRMD